MIASLTQPVLTAQAMREADRYTIEELGIPAFTLMECAGRETAAAIERVYGPVAGTAVSIYCGKGNNGGDGYVVARYLYDRGARLRVVTLGDEDELTPDAASNLRHLRELHRNDLEKRLTIQAFEGTDELQGSYGIHVDAVLGTGLTKELREPVRSLVEWLNEQRGVKVAIDIPTGLHTDYGKALGAAFKADLTVTMGAQKAGLCLNEGPVLAGRVQVVPIGIPGYVLRRSVDEAENGCAYLSSDEIVRLWLPARSHDANKYSVGLALIVAGAEGMTGAPVMAASAAARIGAGYVVCGCDHRIQSVLATKLTEITTIPLPAGPEGIDPAAAMQALGARLEKARGLLIGCGLGRARMTGAFIRRFLEDVDKPVVIDADGLNALEGRTSWLRQHAQGRWILTPHMGEFRRLAGDALEECGIDSEDRVRLAQHFARDWNCVLLLKGLPSVVATPEGHAWICSTGNAALATAGTGDVLAGMTAGLLAQGVSPVEAAVAAVHIGGAAADRIASVSAARSTMAMDIVAELPSLLRDRFEAA